MIIRLYSAALLFILVAGWELFCRSSGISALIIAWVTVAGNSIRVAKTNPIKALRYE